MGVLDKIANTLEAGAKALRRDQLRFPGRPFLWFDLLDRRASAHEMEREVGDGSSSDVLTTPVRWIQRAVAEAPMVVLDLEGKPRPDHRLQRLLDHPNDFYSAEDLLNGTVWDLSIRGDAYWICLRNGNGFPAELWWTPESLMEPKWPNDGSVFISHYDYHVGGQSIRLEPEDVIHFRDGVDPQNIRKGLSPVRGLLREIFTDNEAAAFTAALLRNAGVPGIVLSPTGDNKITREEGEAAESKLETKFTREGRGRPIVMTGPTRLDQFGFNPRELDLSALRDIPEERVTAALGLQAATVGFGTGLQQTKVGATLEETNKQSYRGGAIPRQRIIAGGINRELSDAFPGNATSVEFDLSRVQILQEDENQKVARLERGVRGGILTRREARIELGFDGGDEGGPDDVYLLNLSTLEVPRSANGNRREIIEAQVEERRMLMAASTKQNDGSPTEQRLVESAPRARPTPALLQFARAIDRIRDEAPEAFAADLERFFDRLGRRAQGAMLDALEQSGELEQRSAGAPETKQDSLLIEEVLALLDLVAEDTELRRIFERHFARISEEVAAELEVVTGTAFVFSDPAQREILRRGGTRAGLIDLSTQTRDALFDALADARAEGLAGENLARRIRDRVTAGPWRDAATRARVIARTEGAFAANSATVQAARDMDDTEHMMIFDDRTGFSAEDPDHDICAQMNGRVMTIDEADAAIAQEHPNGTRSATPVNALLLDELELEEVDGGRRLVEPV